jgi:hypothetical protein
MIDIEKEGRRQFYFLRVIGGDEIEDKRFS